MGPKEAVAGLGSWFALWHARYRLLLVQLLVAGTVGSALAYLDNYLLSALTRSLSQAFQASAAASEAGDPLVALASTLSWSLPLTVLGVFVLARLASAAITFWRTRAGGTLQIQSRNDLESEILVHLLHKDDSFFSSHSPAETVNRLSVDISRVSSRRPNLMTGWWSTLLIVGNLFFFLQRDWRLALVGLVACAGGAYWTYRITRNVSSYDRDYLTQDDRVKSQFEDFLRAAPEIQVGHLFGRIRSQFEHRQEGRSKLFRRYVSLRAILGVANIVSALGAFAVMIAILLWMGRHAGAGQATALVLVPAVIWALPSLFSNASALIFLNLEFQLARTSMDRLLEYETARADEGAAGGGADLATATGDAEPLELAKVSYRYTSSDGSQQGGVTDVSTRFEPGRWTAIVGGAGSGKSTLLKILLGRFRPQSGKVCYGERSLPDLGARAAAEVLSLMPQSLALLNASIEDNLLFRRHAAAKGAAEEAQLDADDLALIEEVGLARVCRLKALEMQPGEATDYTQVDADIAAIRKRVRSVLAERCEVTVQPYEEARFDPRHWLLESLLGGRANRSAAVAALLGKKGDAAPLRTLAEGELGKRLVPLARQLLRESQNLLRLDSFALYAQLAPRPLDPRLWQLRSTHLHLALADGESAPRQTKAKELEHAALLAIALTSSAIEQPDADEVEAVLGELAGHRDLEQLTELLDECWSPFAAESVHPYLSWRENLVFGAFEATSSRTGRLVEQTLLELLAEDELREVFTRLGLRFEIGRQGGNLSGGQGQLVALGRALLRRAPVLVLDEPTSALDPASRTAVTDLLAQWKEGRVLITVSHDPELVRHADSIRLMDGGRLVASGSFDTLLAESEAFRNTMKQT